MDLSRYIKGHRSEKALELLGIGVAFTLVQMIVLYLLLDLELAGLNVFLIYRGFFEKYLFPIDKLYSLFADLMYGLFGESYLHVLGFNNVFKLAFFAVFITNLAFIAVMRRDRKDEAG